MKHLIKKIISLFCLIWPYIPVSALCCESYSNAFSKSPYGIKTEKSYSSMYGLYQGKRNYPWPIANPKVGNNMQTIQGTGQLDMDYWHLGLDVISNSGTQVYTPVTGIVTNIVDAEIEDGLPSSGLYWRIEILDEEGLVWTFVHVDKNTFNPEIFDSLKNKTTIKQRTHLANIVDWWWSDYNHIHIEVIQKDGININPLMLLSSPLDNSKPVIEEIGLVQKKKILDGNIVSGPHSLYVKTYDLILHDSYKVPPHKISYSLDDNEWIVVWEFIKIPSKNGSGSYVDVNDFFLSPSCQGCVNGTNYYINLMFNTQTPWETLSNLSLGTHKIKVRVEDIDGNMDEELFSWVNE